MTPTPDDLAHDPVLRRMDVQTMQMLAVLARSEESVSFGEIGRQVQRSERTVSRELLALNDVFKSEKDAEILVRPAGKRLYELTGPGRAFARQVEASLAGLTTAIRAAVSASDVLEMPLTEDCLSDLATLRQAARREGLTVLPVGRRSSEFPSLLTRAWSERPGVLPFDYAMFTAAISVDHAIEAGGVVSLGNSHQVLVRTVSDFWVLAPTHLLGQRPTITLPELRSLGAVLLLPSGGAVRDFVEQTDPAGLALQPSRYRRSTRLDFALRCLELDLLDNAAVVVHATSAETVPQPANDRYSVVRLLNDGEQQFRAMMGLFHDKMADDQMREDTRKNWQRLWSIAQRLWGESR